MPFSDFWTDERIAFLRKHWRVLSCSQIGRELGCSKNAALGKAHRLGLANGVPYKRCFHPAYSREPRQ